MLLKREKKKAYNLLNTVYKLKPFKIKLYSSVNSSVNFCFVKIFSKSVCYGTFWCLLKLELEACFW